MFGFKKRLLRKVRNEIIIALRKKIFDRLEEYRVQFLANSRKQELKTLEYFMTVVYDTIEEYLKEKL